LFIIGTLNNARCQVLQQRLNVSASSGAVQSPSIAVQHAQLSFF
jgi:hypothetical protein